MNVDNMIKNARKEVKDLWEVIEDIIGPSKDWPRWIRDLFWTKHLNHAKRPLISAFAIFNGLNPQVLFNAF